ncbi:hypothetical protein FB45DRAFT_959590 [Roridomyces roridus]|uniref:Uncharacterized protein n=1 Tax=Roridomyces roridus TaxID=1738132 RepID=A0AAD7AXV5_9AGAR|nr:hypothetical protein FB45DRAFT_959590 [Roridomyces roridus]
MSSHQDPTQILELRIDSSSVRHHDESLNEHDSICLLKAPLHEFLRYSREEMSKWLIDLAHDICDPANLRGSLLVWEELSQDWVPVAPTEPLTASVYRYQLPPGIFVDLSKLSRPEARFVVGTCAVESVIQRDGACWVTGCLDPIKATQICPKRIGDDIGQQILRTFANLDPLPGLSICDEIFCLALTSVMDFWFREYRLGFRHVSQDAYECHVFARDFDDTLYTLRGQYPKSYTPSAPCELPQLLHGHRAAPAQRQPQSPSRPPPGLFRWHYLQCVINQFAHEDYKSLAHIHLPGPSLQMEQMAEDREGMEDSDNDLTDDEFELPLTVSDLGADLGHLLYIKEGEEGVVGSPWGLAT